MTSRVVSTAMIKSTPDVSSDERVRAVLADFDSFMIPEITGILRTALSKTLLPFFVLKYHEDTPPSARNNNNAVAVLFFKKSLVIMTIWVVKGSSTSKSSNVAVSVGTIYMSINIAMAIITHSIMDGYISAHNTMR